MAVRGFDGVDDVIILAEGGVNLGGAFTIGCIMELDSATGNEGSPFFLGNVGTDSWRVSLETFGTDLVILGGNGAFQSFPSAPSADWEVILVTKASGTATPRIHRYNLVTATWLHEDAGGTLADAVGAADGIQVGRWGGTEYTAGRMAVVGAWEEVLGNDATIEALGLETSLANWRDAGTTGPSGLWRFNQSTVGETVEDMSGGTADQTTITGTAVVTGDDPPGFSFVIGATPTHLDDNASLTDPATTASISPGANKLLTVFAVLANTGGPVPGAADALISGLGLTWTLHASQSYGQRRRLYLFRAVTGATPPTPGSITLDKDSGSSGTFAEWQWAVAEWDGVDVSSGGANALGTAGAAETTLDTTLAVTVPGTPTPNDAPFVGFGVEIAGVSPVIEATWETLSNRESNDIRHLLTAWDVEQDPTATGTWSSTSSAGALGVLAIAANGGTVVEPDNVTQTHVATEPTITQVHEIQPNNSVHDLVSGSPTIEQGVNIVPDNAVQAHVAQQPALTQIHILQPNSAVHEHTAGRPTIIHVTEERIDITVIVQPARIREHFEVGTTRAGTVTTNPTRAGTVAVGETRLGWIVGETIVDRGE